MKTRLRHYTPVALLLALILVVSTLPGLFLGKKTDAEYRVLVTNYPLYVAAQNILGDTHGVELTLLSGAGAGCLHDYQLTPADRLALERADVIITNGVGEEPFLEGVDPNRVVNAGAELDNLICADHHHEDGHHHEESYNEHVWVSPTRYSRQVRVVLDALIALEPGGQAQYWENATNYMMGIQQVQDGLSALSLSGRACVLFHDSLSYLAEDLGLDVKLTLSAEGESGLSATDLAKVEALAKENPDLVLLYDTQYPIRYTAIDGLVAANQVIALETAVMGEGKPSDWLDAMERNLEKLQKLTGGDTP